MALRFEWDEPEGCTTPRAWCSVVEETHPDRGCPAWDYHRDNGVLCCGNWLQYGVSRGENGETIHASAYYRRVNEAGVRSDYHVGHRWCWTREEAIEFIEQSVRLKLEPLPPGFRMETEVLGLERVTWLVHPDGHCRALLRAEWIGPGA